MSYSLVFLCKACIYITHLAIYGRSGHGKKFFLATNIDIFVMSTYKFFIIILVGKEMDIKSRAQMGFYLFTYLFTQRRSGDPTN